MLQLTTLFLRDSIEDVPKFSVILDGFALNNRLIELSIACVQRFARSPRFTHRDFFSDIGIGLLTSAITAAATLRGESSYEHRTSVLPEVYEATVDNLKKAYDVVVVVRRKDARYTSERRFGVRKVESSGFGEPY